MVQEEDCVGNTGFYSYGRIGKYSKYDTVFARQSAHGRSVFLPMAKKFFQSAILLPRSDTWRRYAESSAVPSLFRRLLRLTPQSTLLKLQPPVQDTAGEVQMRWNEGQRRPFAAPVQARRAPLQHIEVQMQGREVPWQVKGAL